MATQHIRGVEVSRIPGLFQTADYARHAFEANAEFRRIPRDVEAAVRARMRRQEALYKADKLFRFVVWEAALYVLTCPREVMAAQLDRLTGLIGMDTVEIHVLPLGAQLKRVPGHGFWIYDRRRVIVETINDDLVHSVELDPAVARQAADALAQAGYRPHLRVGDGEQPWPDLGLVDRLIATCALRYIPYTLLRQVRPGGVVVAPLAREFWSGALVQLRVQGDGTATGPFCGGATYMPMRAHRVPDLHDVRGKGRARAAGLDPARLLDLGFALYAGARLPGVRLIQQNTPEGARVWVTRENGSGAMAATGEEVWQYGPGLLWEEIEQVWWEYESAGRPDARQFGLTVTDRGQQVWLRNPDEIIRPGRA